MESHSSSKLTAAALSGNLFHKLPQRGRHPADSSPTPDLLHPSALDLQDGAAGGQRTGLNSKLTPGSGLHWIRRSIRLSSLLSHTGGVSEAERIVWSLSTQQKLWDEHGEAPALTFSLTSCPHPQAPGTGAPCRTPSCTQLLFPLLALLPGLPFLYLPLV